MLQDLLLSNIQQLPDQAAGLKLTADGQFVVLEDWSSSASHKVPPLDSSGVCSEPTNVGDADESVA